MDTALASNGGVASNIDEAGVFFAAPALVAAGAGFRRGLADQALLVCLGVGLIWTVWLRSRRGAREAMGANVGVS